MQEKIFSILFDQDEITWQSIIYELVRTEQMNPWDIDVSLLSQRYIGMLKKLKELDFRISGKVLLAAAILLRIKSDRLLGHDIDAFDRMFSSDEEEGFYEELESEMKAGAVNLEDQRLIPKTPQPRKRKVSVYDLVDALQKALKVRRRRILQTIPTKKIEVPQKKMDISEVIKRIYSQIVDFFRFNKTKLTFTQLVPSEKKEDKVLTFIPLLHLTTQRKINLFQKEHFGEIEVRLNKQIAKELGENI